MSNQGMLLAGCSAAVLLALAGAAHAADPDPSAAAPDATDSTIPAIANGEGRTSDSNRRARGDAGDRLGPP